MIHSDIMTAPKSIRGWASDHFRVFGGAVGGFKRLFVAPSIHRHRQPGMPIQIIPQVWSRRSSFFISSSYSTIMIIIINRCDETKSRYVIESFCTGTEETRGRKAEATQSTAIKEKSIIIQNVKLFQFRDDVPFTLIFSLPHKGGA